LDDRGIRVLFPQGQEIFVFSTAFRPALGPSQSPANGAFYPGVKRPGREADHSLPSSAEVKNGDAMPPLPTCLHGLVLNFLSSWTIFTFPLPYLIELSHVVFLSSFSNSVLQSATTKYSCQIIWKGCCKCCPVIFLQFLRKTTKIVSQDSLFLGRNLNSGPPEFEAEVPTSRPLLLRNQEAYDSSLGFCWLS
jgi:hypothetical protein